jgi:hypothetical protein
MFIDKIQVFQGETKAELPCLLIHVRQPLSGSEEMQGRDGRLRITSEVYQREASEHIVRVHTFRANL